MKFSFDYITFRNKLESALGTRFQSYLASELETTVSTVNNWCSERCGGGPSALNRSKIDDLLRKRSLQLFNWSELMIPRDMDIDVFHSRLNEPLDEYKKKDEHEEDLYLTVLELQKEIFKLKEELAEKQVEIIKYQKEAVEARAETYKLKKHMMAIKK